MAIKLTFTPQEIDQFFKKNEAEILQAMARCIKIKRKKQNKSLSEILSSDMDIKIKTYFALLEKLNSNYFVFLEDLQKKINNMEGQYKLEPPISKYELFYPVHEDFPKELIQNKELFRALNLEEQFKLNEINEKRQDENYKNFKLLFVKAINLYSNENLDDAKIQFQIAIKFLFDPLNTIDDDEKIKIIKRLHKNDTKTKHKKVEILEEFNILSLAHGFDCKDEMYKLIHLCPNLTKPINGHTFLFDLIDIENKESRKNPIDQEILKVLLKNPRTQINKKNDGITPLMLAFEKNDNEIIGYLLSRTDINLFVVDYEGHTLLDRLIKNNDFSNMMYLIREMQNSVNKEALDIGLNVPYSLIKKENAKINANDLPLNHNGRTPIMNLASKNIDSYLGMVLQFFGKHVQINAVNIKDNNTTALMYAAKKKIENENDLGKQLNVLQALIKHGADILQADTNGKTALDFAYANSSGKVNKVTKYLEAEMEKAKNDPKRKLSSDSIADTQAQMAEQANKVREAEKQAKLLSVAEANRAYDRFTTSRISETSQRVAEKTRARSEDVNRANQPTQTTQATQIAQLQTVTSVNRVNTESMTTKSRRLSSTQKPPSLKRMSVKPEIAKKASMPSSLPSIAEANKQIAGKPIVPLFDKDKTKTSQKTAMKEIAKPSGVNIQDENKPDNTHSPH